MKQNECNDCTCILVEDSLGDVLILKDIFKNENLPIQIQHFPDGLLAYEYLVRITESGNFSNRIVLLDLNMPKMNGKEVLQKLKRKNVKIPIIVFSGSENPNDRDECIAYGAKDYFIKPWDYLEFVKLVKGPIFREFKEVCSHAF